MYGSNEVFDVLHVCMANIFIFFSICDDNANRRKIISTVPFHRGSHAILQQLQEHV